MSDLLITLNVRIRDEPHQPGITVNKMIEAAKRVYGHHGFQIQVASVAPIAIPERLRVFDVDRCDSRRPLTGDQVDLFARRDGIGENEIFAYFVYSVQGTYGFPLNACAAHRRKSVGITGQPALAISAVRANSNWTLAHEMGHVLGLEHRDNNRELMHGKGVRNIVGNLPRLSDDDLERIRARIDLVRTSTS